MFYFKYGILISDLFFNHRKCLCFIANLFIIGPRKRNKNIDDVLSSVKIRPCAENHLLNSLIVSETKLFSSNRHIFDMDLKKIVV